MTGKNVKKKAGLWDPFRKEVYALKWILFRK